MGCGSSSNKDDVIDNNSAPSELSDKGTLPLDDDHFLAGIGFVIKTKKPGDAKVFINVFHHASVSYLVVAEKPKFSTDRSDQPCLTYDCVINSAVQTICATNDDSKLYIGEQLIDILNKKFDESLAPDFKIPKMKRGYVGADIPSFKIPEDVGERLKTTREGEAPKAKVATIANISAKNTPTPTTNTSSVPIIENEEDKLPWSFAGYALKKSGSSFVGLQTRYFVLSDDGSIDYFQSEEVYKNGGANKGKINLQNVDKDITSKKGFSLIAANAPLLINIPVSGRMYEIFCETEQQSRLWASIIDKHIKRVEDDD